MQRKIISTITLCAAIWASAQTTYTPPVTLTIDSQEAFDEWTPANVNNDDKKFAYSSYNGGAYVGEDRYNDINDWMISPAIELVAGTEYKIVLTCKKGSSIASDYSRFTINVGNEANVDTQDITLYTNDDFRYSSFTEVTATYTPETSGPAYFGIHCYNVAYKGGFVIKSLAVEKVVPLPGAVSGLTVAAAAEGVQEAVLSWTWPDKTNLGGNLEQIGGAYIYRGTSNTFTANEASLIGTYTDTATPGATAEWTDTTVPSPGKYYYRVVPFNDNGTSPSTASAVQSPWIGKDTGIGSVSGVTATVSPESETTILLTFTPPTGSNGGYIDLADVAYKITRTSGAGTTVTLEDAWQGEQPYVDATLPGLDSYYYTVSTVYNGSTSWSGTKSNTLTTGGTAALPYSQDFTDSNSLALFTLFHGEGATRDWGRSSSALNYWGNPADAWAVLPKFRLEAGKAYELIFTARVNRATSPKELYVYTGTAATAEALDKEVFHETVTNTLAEKKTVIISVAADGNYCVAFRCYGPSDSNDIYVDDITLAETVITPLPVSELTATAAPEGELKATLSWLNPSRTTADGEITVLERVDVLLGTDVVATVTAPEAGATSTADVPVEAPGVYTFSVVPYLNGEAGASVSATTTWVGCDTPAAPQNVAVELRDDERVVTFDAVTTGINEGYVDAAAIRYTVTRNGDVLTDDLAETIFTDTEAGLPLAMYTYAVSAHYADFESEATAAAAVQLGDALELPYTPDFADAATFDLWTVSKTAGGLNTWKHDSGSQTLSTSSESAWAFTPPFIAQEGTAKVSFKATYTMSRYIKPVSVYLCTENTPEAKAAPELIAEYTPTGMSYPDTQEHIFDVPATGKYYIGYLSDPDNWGIRLHQSDVEQVSVTTGVDAVDAAKGIAVNPDGTISTATAGTLTLYSLSGTTAWSAATAAGAILRPDVQPGLYVAAWRADNGTATTFRYIR